MRGFPKILMLFFGPFHDNRKDSTLFCAVLFITSITCIPYVWINHLSGAQFYNWILPPYPEDSLSYMAWVKQAALGNLLFKIKFTSIPHSSVLFHPLFLVSGWVSFLFGWHAGFSLFVTRALLVFVFLYIFVHFLLAFQMPFQQILLSFLLLSFSSGFGWFVGEQSVDMWMPECNTLWSLVWNPVFPAAYGIILLAILWATKAMDAKNESERRKWSMLSGTMLGLLAFVHPYDVIFLSLVLLLLCLVKKVGRKVWTMVWPFLLFAAPPVFIQIALSNLHPILSAHSTVKMVSPSIQYVFSGLGFVGCFGGFGVFYGFFKWRSEKIFFPAAFWLLSSLVLAYLPVWFQSKMLGGIHLPAVILAAVAFDRIVLRFVKWRVELIILVVFFVFVSAPTNYFLAKDLQAKVLSNKGYYFLSPPLAKALAYLRVQGDSDSIVLADLGISSLIPGESGNTVLFGHWAQSVDAEEKMRWLGRFMYRKFSLQETARRAAELRDAGIRYILIEPHLLFSFGKSNVDKLSRLGKVVFADKDVSLIMLE